MITALKIYTRDMLVGFAAYGLVLFGVNSYLSGTGADLPQAAQAGLALLPMLPVLLVVRAVLVFARSWDELQRKKAMESVLIAFFLVGFGTFAYGFLEGVGFPKLDIIWVMPLLIAAQSLALSFVSWTYR